MTEEQSGSKPSQPSSKVAAEDTSCPEEGSISAQAGRSRPEIFIGLVAALGSPLDSVCTRLLDRLSEAGYEADIVRVSDVLKEIEGVDELEETRQIHSEHKRLKCFMKAGTVVREKSKRGDALAALALGSIRTTRESSTGDQQKPGSNRAYVLRSLKHPDEVDLLRRVYGEHFVLLGIGAPHEVRVRNLSEEIARSDGHLKANGSRAAAEERIAIDEREPQTSLGQDVRDTFPLADFFIDASTSALIKSSLDRLARLMFSDPFVTPSRDETAMFHAYAAALRSAALGRQVGAAIVGSAKGDVLAVGMNEVPKAGGGHYWEGDEPDGRDFVLEKDTNDEHKRAIIRQVLRSLQGSGWLSQGYLGMELEQLVDCATRKDGPIRNTWLMSLTEFGRDVHAEMSAIVSAARRGVSTQDAHLFCTTFPCHNCAKHIIASGISRVVYIEPYAKSFTREFHLDSVEIDAVHGDDSKIMFEPFVGVAPRRYVGWFAMTQERKRSGRTVRWRIDQAFPWCGMTDPGYISREREELDRIRKTLKNVGIRTR